MDSPFETLKNAFQGDIEIAGRRIPKIAVVAGGGVLIVLLILLSRRGSGSARPTAGLSDTAGVGGGFTGGMTGESEQAAGGLIGGSLEDISAQFSQQLADQSRALTDQINQSSQTQADNLASQLSDIYSQIGASGGGAVPIYSDQVAPLPVDYVMGSLPVDSGLSSYPSSPVVALPSKPPTIANVSVGNTGFNGANIKPSNPKPQGKKLPQLGAAILGTKSTKDKVGKLSTGKKTQDFIPSAVTGFNKNNLVKPTANAVKPSVMSAQKKPNIPSPVPQKTQKPTSAINVKPSASGKSGVTIPPTIKTIGANQPTNPKKPVTTKPASLNQKSGGYKPIAAPKQSAYKPVQPQNPIALPAYYSPYSFMKPGLMYGSKISSSKPKATVKGK